MLCSGALGDDFSRMIRSPPAANGAPSVGFMPSVLTRLAYAIGTSPLTATVSSLPPEPEQPASANSAARAHGTSSWDRLKLRDVMTASLSVVRLLLSNSLPGNAAVAAARGRQSGGEMQG